MAGFLPGVEGCDREQEGNKPEGETDVTLGRGTEIGHEVEVGEVEALVVAPDGETGIFSNVGRVSTDAREIGGEAEEAVRRTTFKNHDPDFAADEADAAAVAPSKPTDVHAVVVAGDP